MPQTFRRGKVAHAQERISNFKFLPGALRGEIGSQGNAGRIAFERALAMRRAAASDAAARVRDGEGRELALAQDVGERAGPNHRVPLPERVVLAGGSA